MTFLIGQSWRLRGAQSEETRGNEGETQLDGSIQLRDTGGHGRETSGELGCPNTASKTLRERAKFEDAERDTNCRCSMQDNVQGLRRKMQGLEGV